MVILLTLVTAFLIGFLAMPVLIGAFKKFQVVDKPGGRKIHKNDTPSMGGIVIVFSVLLTAFLWLDVSNLMEIRYVIAAFALMFFVGLRDDLVELSPFQKLGGQSVAAFMVVFMADIRISGLYGFLGIYELPLVLSYAITFISILALTNAFNLIDGLDGLAATISVLTFGFLAWWFNVIGMPSFGMFSLIIAGSVLGFLVFNWHPAKIFMGDTGSLSLGFALSLLTVLFIDTNGTMAPESPWKFNAPIASGIALMIVPIYDTTRIFTRRIRRGRSPFSPDKNHVHHFLMRMGLTHDKVSITLGVIKLFFIALIFIGSAYSDYVMLPLIVCTALLFGSRLDSLTLKRVKEKAKNSPPILGKKYKALNRKPLVKNQFTEHFHISDN
ncbi:glycosyltransferase family 4 protein [Cecembia calidifontis]|uniref:UDP-N-acetylmuramyl pentapeptide phosphotransferase/UDP-N-acetylglucosamine-1-phosphate transferase n=1 Tax=Cecembia calidifontis TaxID=1187080 RepID=A0A4V2F735_9BACT|nr:MraY family glycosyltransferase [Cecembia calidifontis]RZS98439.1 UDP-N-acetylmuramyl pentapeptide phosphotransferase/UDP-N-acetylglucosamine-1-phosphate transferase [Cecembia calidifontis]